MIISKMALETNRTLCNRKQGRVTDYYIPAYFRMVYKKMDRIEIQTTTAMFSGTIILSVNCENLSQQVINHIRNHSEICINDEKMIHLGEADWPSKTEHSKIKFEDNILSFTYRDNFDLELSCNPFLMPFIHLDFALNIQVKSLTFLKTKIHFNLMKHKHRHEAMFSCKNSDDIDYYGFANNTLRTYIGPPKDPEEDDIHYLDCSLEEPRDQNGNNVAAECSFVPSPKELQPFKNIKFEFKLFRYPELDIITILVPIWLLSVITLFIFFQSTQLKDRNIGIATLMVAYMAFLPTVRERIPPSPKITMLDIIIYLSISMTLLCLGRSYLDYFWPPTAYVWNSDPFFIISLTILLMTVAIILVLLIMHYKIVKTKFVKSKTKVNKPTVQPLPNQDSTCKPMHQEPSITQSPLQRYQSVNSTKFNRKYWSNKRCDNHFQQCGPTLCVLESHHQSL